MGLPKIPDDIYEKRCKYCKFFTVGQENRELRSNEVFSNKPKVCRIQGIARYCYQTREKDGTCIEHPYEDGECRSFNPNYGYPVCYHCKYYNHFREDGNCCSKNVPMSKRRSPAIVGPSKYNEFDYLVCDNWTCSTTFQSSAIRLAAEGRLPRVFDSKTFKLLSPIEESRAAAEWLEIEKKHFAETEKKAKEEQLAKRTDENGQLSLF